MRAHLVAACAAFAIAFGMGDGVSANEGPRRGPVVTLPWAAAQVVPSPEALVRGDQVLFGMRWQLTPVLYSFGIHRSQDPWRSFVVEPIVRHSGSTELYVSPEYFGVGGSAGDRFGIRVGVRSTFPVVERGDYLSFSLGTSWLRWQGRDRVGYEAGAHVLFGFVGTLITWEPDPDAQRWIATLQLKFF